MNRGNRWERLRTLRELQLREVVTELKVQAAALAQAELNCRAAQTASANALTVAGGLHDLHTISATRLDLTKQVRVKAGELEAIRARFDHARRQAEAVNSRCDAMRDRQRLQLERAQELTADQFFSWQQGAASRH